MHRRLADPGPPVMTNRPGFLAWTGMFYAMRTSSCGEGISTSCIVSPGARNERTWLTSDFMRCGDNVDDSFSIAPHPNQRG